MRWTRPIRRTSNQRRAARSDGFKSGLERKVAEQIAQQTGRPASYEKLRLKYTLPDHTYTPDFELPNGIIVECKGLFEGSDRTKHIAVKAQHPDRDIRFVFSNSAKPIYKGSKTTYAAWCNKHGFQFADKLIPLSWFKERSCSSARPSTAS